MLAKYTCDYLHNSGKVCGKACTRSKGCRLHHLAKKRYPCTDCGKPTGSDCGRCKLHKRGYYTIQYINRLRDKAIKNMLYGIENGVVYYNEPPFFGHLYDIYMSD